MTLKIKSSLMAAILIIMALSIHAQNNNVMEKTKFSPEQEKVLNAVEKMTEAFHNHDIEGVMASYEPKPLVVFEPETPVSNNQTLREMFQGAFMINPKFVYSGHEVFINGNIATHFAPWTMKGQAPDGTKVEQTGLSVAILRKQPNGEWLMIFDNPHGQFLMNK